MNKIIQFLKSLFGYAESEFFHGVIEDPRSVEAKANDYTHKEVSAGAALQWVEKPQDQWKKFSIRNQFTSSSCVAQSMAKALEVMTGIVMSATPLYQKRSNFPDKGMWLQDVGNIAKKIGTTGEAQCASQNMTEDEMNNAVLPLRMTTFIDAYIQPDFSNIDELAEIVSNGTPLLLIFYSSYEEWTDVPVANPATVNFDVRHCICFPTDFTLWNGQKALIIEDSWGKATTLGTGGQRVITEDFLKQRCHGALYPIKNNISNLAKPSYVFSKELSYGLMGDSDVKILQDILKFEQFIPASVVSTGNFLNMTAHALQKWQIAHDLMDFANVTNFSLIRFGQRSIDVANSIYGV